MSEEAPRDRRRLRAAHARPTEAMPTVTILRTPLGKLGCRISPDDRVSEVHARGAADLAGLKVGCLVKSINGKPVSELPDLIKQSVFKFVMEVEDAPPKNKMAPGKKRKSTAAPKSPVEAKASKPNVPAPQKTAAPQKKASPKASTEAPQRYVYLVWHTHDIIGRLGGSYARHNATVRAVYNDKKAAQQHANELGGLEDEVYEYDEDYTGDDRMRAIVVSAPVLSSSADPRSRRVICEYNYND